MSSHFAEIEAALAMLDGVLALRTEERKPLPADRAGLSASGIDPIPDRSWLCGGSFESLSDALPLTDTDLLLLVAAVAPTVDERYERRIAALSDRCESGRITGEALRNLGGRTIAGRARASHALGPFGTLRQSRLLELGPHEHGPLAGDVTVSQRALELLVDAPAAAPELLPDFPATVLQTVHTMDDLVISSSARQRLAHVLERIRLSPTVLGDWGVGKHHDHVSGITLLLHGPPGTGKTMTAAVLAAQAGFPALRVDLSTLVSKYIGETAKNLEQIFRYAEAHPCVLFFDEADSVFGVRGEVSDARDRYANQEVSYLLQRIEAFPGVVVLATNLLANIDHAFLRRIDVMVELTPPDQRQRQALWRQVYPDAVPQSGLHFEDLARQYQLTGAQIKDAAVEAAFQAAANGGVVTEDHLERAIRLQFAKSGLMAPH